MDILALLVAKFTFGTSEPSSLQLAADPQKKRLYDSLTELSVRLLSSRWPNKEPRYNLASEALKKTLIQKNSDMESILRLGDLLSTLQNQQVPKRKTEMLLFFKALCDKQVMESNLTMLDVEMLESAHYLDNFVEPPPPAPTSTTPNLLINGKTRTGKAWNNLNRDIKQWELFKDLINVIQAVDGEFIVYNQSLDLFIPRPELNLAESTEYLITQIGEVGTLCRIVMDFTANIALNKTGLMIQCFRSSLQRELASYFREVALIESKFNLAFQSSSGDLKGDSIMTLRSLLVQLDPHIRKFRLLNALITGCQEGGSSATIITIMHRISDHGDPFIRNFVNKILEEVSVPFFNILRRWIYDGELDDPFDEFFVTAEVDQESADLWNSKYKLVKDVIPEFIGQSLARKAFMIGKSINFLRYGCDDSKWLETHRKNDNKVLQYADLEGLGSSIDEAYRETSGRLIHVLITRHKLIDHLQVLKRYLLLTQGDFVIYFIEMLGDSLSESASTLHRHKLISSLEAALRATNIVDHNELLRRIDVRTFRHNAGDTGWDVIALDYHVNAPVSTVISPKEMSKYHRLFSFLWQINRVHYILSSTWRMRTVSHHRIRQLREHASLFHFAHTILNEMLQCIYQIQYYLQFEVLECTWSELLQGLGRKDLNLDQLIELHQVYLLTLMKKAMLDMDGMKDSLLLLFQQIIRFCNLQRRLYDIAGKQYSAFSSSANQTDQGSDIFANSYANPAINHQDWKRRLEAFRFEYKQTLVQIIGKLQGSKIESLRSLSFRLNYNNFY